MECRVSWLGNSGMAFSAETGSGHLINMDGALEAGGKNLAPRPMELPPALPQDVDYDWYIKEAQSILNVVVW